MTFRSGPRTDWLIQPLALAVLGGLPGLVLADVVVQRRSIVVAAAAAAAACAVTLACEVAATRRVRLLRHIPVIVLIMIGGALATAFGVSAAWPGSNDHSLINATTDAVVHGWAAVVTSPVPATAEPRLLVPPALIAWTAVSAGVTIAFRSRSRTLPLLPGIVAFVLALVAAGSHQASPVVTGTAFLGTTAAFLASRTPRPAGTHTQAVFNRRAAVSAVGLALIAAIAASLVGPTLAAGRDSEPFDPREYISPPHVPSDAENPLDLVASWLQADDDPMYTVTADEAVRTRLVALDTFDGAAWTVSGTWVTFGTTLVPPSRTTSDSHPVSAEITIDGLGGPWLPSFGDSPEVSGVAAILHPGSGSLAVNGGTVAGITYGLRGDVTTSDPAGLQHAPVATDDAARAATELPAEPPEQLRQMALDATAKATTPFLRAVYLQIFLRTSFRLDPEMRAGHSYGHLLRAFTERAVGTSEQFATMFAVLGRIVGLPTRVVVGFEPGAEIAPGTFAVQSGDVVVWPEVRFEGIGWVPFEPTPSVSGDVDEDDTTQLGGQTIVLRPEPPPEPQSAPDEIEPSAASDELGSAGDSTSPVSTRSLVVGVAVVVGAVTLGLLAMVVAKRRRTRLRRRDGDARDQVLGAWHDVLDRLVETGMTRPLSRTVEEHVAQTADASAALTGLYRPVSRALYGLQPVDGDDATQAWRCRDRFVQSLRSRSSRWVRVRRAIDVRPLLHPAGRGSPARVAR